MFTGSRFITKGVSEDLPSLMQYILWYLIETMEVEVKDYLQVFQLDNAMVGGRRKQMILHSQEQPDYQKIQTICAKQIITGKIYVIDDGTNRTMLWADEY